jgi:hypothetical protein
MLNPNKEGKFIYIQWRRNKLTSWSLIGSKRRGRNGEVITPSASLPSLSKIRTIPLTCWSGSARSLDLKNPHGKTETTCWLWTLLMISLWGTCYFT